MPAETNAIDHLAGRLLAGNDTPISVGLTAARAGTGVTHVAVALARAMSGRLNRRTILVDLNLSSPRLASVFRIAREPGLEEVLGGEAVPGAAIRRISERLSVMPAGDRMQTPKTLLHETGFSFLRHRLLQHFDVVLFDCAAMDRPMETGAVASAIGTMLLVVAAERTRTAEARGAIAALEKAGASVAGAILNRQRRYVPAWLDRHL